MVQEQIISLIIQTGDASVITQYNLTEDYFFDHVAEFKFIKNHLNKYNQVPDATSFLNNFENFQYMEVNEPLTYLLSEIQKEKTDHEIRLNYKAVQKLLAEGNIEKVTQIIRDLGESLSCSTQLVATNITSKEAIEERFDAYEKKIDHFDEYYITTGFKELDDIIGGWDANEELAVIYARPGVGKTWLALKAAEAAAAAGKTVGIYSGEMSTNKVAYRIDTLSGGVANGSLIHGGASVKNQYRSYLDSIKERLPGDIWVLTPADIGGAATVSALRAFVEKYHLDVLVVDQYSLLEDEKHAVKPNEQTANLSKAMKLLQTIKKMPIICVSQQNRDDVEDGNDVAHIAQSDRIGQDATTALAISKKDDRLEIYIAKARDGGDGKKLVYQVNLNTGDFRFIPSADAPAASNQSTGYQQDEVF